MALLLSLFYTLISSSIKKAYKLDLNFDASNLLDSFDFINSHDIYTDGFASYVSKDEAISTGLAKTVDNRVYLGVDNSTVIDVTPQGGRKSVRLESHDTIDHGLVIADFRHVPAKACGMWPAFSLVHGNEHDGGLFSKMTLVESISYIPHNEITLSTTPADCTMNTQKSTGNVFSTNCSYATGGCGAAAHTGTFGEPFIEKGGGVWAAQIEATGIKVWFFPRRTIPGDIRTNAPEPGKWGTPIMSFAPKKCDIRGVWAKMKIVFNITFCGDYAGGDAWGSYTSCRSRTQFTSCNEYVAQTPSAFDEVHWLINSVKTYTYAD
ncbi:glycoside hydrolase family 16 protein [Boeremia exigua]|uniref:glycoside hydrolase family 16 protein n=1 Tax=Boeremia exigua TaxID=749465 RepID=UPI001E8EF132|nr:glycoside hydrolase family 16 protein [Boeremia exigua]KAH6620091.1 glycoside hydrolase family 16 protein [Boeremia exigua]